MNIQAVAAHFDLGGKVILVTGGSRGLGLQMSRAFAQAGATVVVSSRKREACERAAADIAAEVAADNASNGAASGTSEGASNKASNGAASGTSNPKPSGTSSPRCLGVACHVGDWEACDALVERVYDEFGRIDVLVNNAGMSPLYGSLSSVSRELWDKVIGVNLAGPFRLSAVVGERMVEAGSGAIINVSSTASVAPSATEAPYGAAKAGINNLTKMLARTFAPQVRTNCIMPGPFLTDIADAWGDEVKAAISQMVPLGRAGMPEEIVGVALFLASDASSFTNGAIIKVDGGMAFDAG